MAPPRKAFLREIHIDHDPQADIAVVHGLDPLNNPEHAYKTWSSPGGVLWLRDLLPKNPRTPRVRVLLYGYNSSAVFGASTSGVQGASRTLLEELSSHREGCSDRPLIFVCHSLGGIVAKNAFINSYIDPDHKALYDSTKGFAFFATPHRGGGNKASLGDAVVKVVRALGYAKNDIMVALRTDSIIAGPINQQFRHLIKQTRIVSFIETWPTAHAGLVVGRNSAALDLPGETQVEMEASHSTICKFSDPNDDLYRRMEHQLIKLLGFATGQDSWDSTSPSNPANFREPPDDEPPPYQSQAESTSASLKPEAAKRGRSKSEVSEDTASKGMTDEQQTTQVVRFFRALSPFRPARTPAANLVAVMSEEHVNWPILMLPLGRNLSERGCEMVERPLLFDRIISVMSQGAPVSLYGIGGSGKTQLALHLAEWFVDRTPEASVLWINASSKETCGNSLADILAACGIRGESKTLQYMSLKRWLEDFEHGRWLMVFDAATVEAVQEFFPFLPECGHGQVVFTSDSLTAAEKLANSGTCIEVGSFETIEALALVSATLKDEFHIIEQETSIKEIIHRLDGLPLAISQAVAFMNTNRLSPAAYLAEIATDEKLADFLDFPHDSTSSSASKSLYTIWKLAFDKLQREDPLAIEILATASFLEADDVPIFLIEAVLGGSSLTTALQSLRDYSFLVTNANVKTFSTHSVVQVGVQRWLKDKKKDWAKKVLITISEAFPYAANYNAEDWKEGTSLLPHALSILSCPFFRVGSSAGTKKILSSSVGGEHMSRATDVSDAITILRSKIGMYFWRKSDFAAAQENTEIAIANTDSGSEVVETWKLRAKSALVLTVRELGHISVAHEMAMKLKRECKAKLGKKSSDTSEAYRLLSLTFQEEGKYKESLNAAQKSFACAKAADEVQSPRSLSILRSQRRLGTAYELLCKFSEAEDVMAGAALGYQARGEQNNREALDLQYRLSWLQRAAGYYDDSEITARESYAQSKKVLGAQHTHTLKTLHSLAATKLAQELWEEAASEFEAILEQCIQFPGYGSEHKYAQVLRVNLAQAYEGMGPYRYAEAKELHAEALKSRKTTLSRGHPDTQFSQAQLIRITWKLTPQDHSTAKASCQDLLKVAKKSTTGDLATQWSLMSTLAEIHAYQADPTFPSSESSNSSRSTPSDYQRKVRTYWKEAAVWQMRLLKSMDKALGGRHPETAKAATACVRYLDEAGDSKSAATTRTRYGLPDAPIRAEIHRDIDDLGLENNGMSKETAGVAAKEEPKFEGEGKEKGFEGRRIEHLAGRGGQEETAEFVGKQYSADTVTAEAANETQAKEIWKKGNSELPAGASITEGMSWKFFAKHDPRNSIR